MEQVWLASSTEALKRVVQMALDPGRVGDPMRPHAGIGMASGGLTSSPWVLTPLTCSQSGRKGLHLPCLQSMAELGSTARSLQRA